MIALMLLACTATSAPPETTDTSASTQDTGPPPSCTRYDEPDVMGRVEDKALTEISGIVASHDHPGVLWIHEDSGRPAKLTAIDAAGQTLATITLSGVNNLDWEDIALGPCDAGTCLFVADVGDNNKERGSVDVLRLPEPDPAAGDQTILPERFPATYPAGPRNAEALVVTADGVPHILTKGDTTEIYRYPSLTPDQSVTLEAAGSVDAVYGKKSGLADLVTAADLSPDGQQLAVRTYGRIWLFAVGEAGLTGAFTERVEVESRTELQGEALAFDRDGQALWHVSEGKRPSLYRIGCAD